LRWYRKVTVFPKPLGNPAKVNEHGQKVLESILKSPEKVVYERPHPDFGRVLDVVIPGKGGARFTTDGEMIGFLEP
jgi:filamentous hemagglutinin